MKTNSAGGADGVRGRGEGGGENKRRGDALYRGVTGLSVAMLAVFFAAAGPDPAAVLV